MLHYCQPPGEGGAFSRDFTTILAPECRALSGALKIEKLKAPLNPGPEGAVDTNDWCINTINPYKHGVLLRGMGKQNSPRCHVAKRGIPSGAILFAYLIFTEK